MVNNNEYYTSSKRKCEKTNQKVRKWRKKGLVPIAHVTVEIALLGKLNATNVARELRLHSALVVLVSPQWGVERVGAATSRAIVLLRWLLIEPSRLAAPLCRRRRLRALQILMATKRSLESKSAAAVDAKVLLRAYASSSRRVQHDIRTVGSGTETSSEIVSGRGQRRYSPIRSAVRPSLRVAMGLGGLLGS